MNAQSVTPSPTAYPGVANAAIAQRAADSGPTSSRGYDAAFLLACMALILASIIISF
jgi:hypothetical protein